MMGNQAVEMVRLCQFEYRRPTDQRMTSLAAEQLYHVPDGEA